MFYCSHVKMIVFWICKKNILFIKYIIKVNEIYLSKIEENNRMRKTRDLFKKIRDTKGTFHARMGTIKDRNSMDLTEAEDIKKRWQEYIEELYKKDLNDPDNHNGMITHLQSAILGVQSQVGLRKHHYEQS